ncbi:MAG: response regulator [Anaerolineae bacterium]
MSYKVFFVEDEIVTREGIRDKVDWRGHGFEFCGEAPDGEMALPLLQAVQPDVVITDIKMPFMDGLELSRIVRERLPAAKIVILSGHDEFEYAQAAIQLGVTEYLLKPVTVQDLHTALQKIALQLDQERQAAENVRKLQRQVEENRTSLRERLLLDLVVGRVSSAEAIEKAQPLGLELIAGTYLVVVIKLALRDPVAAFDYLDYEQARQIVSDVVERDAAVFLIKKDLEELVLIMTGNTLDALEARRTTLLNEIRQRLRTTKCSVTIGCGLPKQRLTDVCSSFIEALIDMQATANRSASGRANGVGKAELLKINKSAVDSYLKCGVKEDFDDFFETFIRPLGESALKSHILKNYLVMDVVLTTAKFLNELGGNVDHVIPDLNFIEDLQTVDQIREQMQSILVSALVFRDSQATNQYAGMIQQARDYIERHFRDPNLSLTEVASHAHLSPSHFSTVFSQETGQTFKDYLTEIRIRTAKELLRGTTLKSFEIAEQIGYSDPHYFSYVFRKHTSLSPKEFRLQAQAG